MSKKNLTIQLNNCYVQEKLFEWLLKTGDALLVHNIEPAVGSIVYCNLAIVAEHTGIYVGNGEIVHLEGNGRIKKVSADRFCQRLSGKNPSFTIFCPVNLANKAIGDEEVAKRALARVGNREEYNVAYHNCHCFVAGCLLGSKELFCPSFTILEELLRKKYGFLMWRATNLNH